MRAYAIPAQSLMAASYCAARLFSAPIRAAFIATRCVSGEQQYLVDDTRRLALGDAIGSALPLTALHFYPQHNVQNGNA